MERNRRWRVVLVAAALLCAGAGRPAFAACSAVPNGAQVTQLRWGTLAVPSGSVTYKVDGTGGADSGTGSKIYGVSGRGQYTISKKSGNEGQCATITINITNIVPGNANLTLGSFTGNYNGVNLVGAPPWTGLPMPAAGKTLFLGATATYNGSIPVGALTPTFNIAVHYDARPDTLYGQTASVAFDSALTFGSLVDISFGKVQALTAGTYTIDTAGVVTPSGGGVLFPSTPVAGSMTIYGSATQTITISTGAYVAGGIGGGVTLSNATCSYNGGAETACDAGLSTQAAPTSVGKTLLLGVRATVNASQTAGSAATPSFTVTVVYT